MLFHNDDKYLTAKEIDRKRMYLLWLDPPTLGGLEQPIRQRGKVCVEFKPGKEYEIDMNDYIWAKEIEAVVDKAYAAGQKQDFKTSIEFYKKALDLAPGCDLFLMSIGTCFANLGNKELAVRYMKRASEISPDNNRIRQNLQRLLS